MQLNQGSRCPNCGYLIEDVTEVTMETRLSRKHFVLALLIGLGMGLSLASIGSSWWGALGAALLAGAVAFMISVRLFAPAKRDGNGNRS